MNLHIRKGRQWRWWWHREAWPYTKKTGHPGRMWRQSATGETFVFNLNTICVFWGCLKAVWGSSHLALEAEDGDRKTHHGCDSQTQNHWFGVVKAGEREGSQIHWLYGFGWVEINVSHTLIHTCLHHNVYLPRHKSHHEGHAQSLREKVK